MPVSIGSLLFPVGSVRISGFCDFIRKKIAARQKTGYDSGKGCDGYETLRDRRRRGDPDL